MYHLVLDADSAATARRFRSATPADIEKNRTEVVSLIIPNRDAFAPDKTPTENATDGQNFPWYLQNVTKIIPICLDPGTGMQSSVIVRVCREQSKGVQGHPSYTFDLAIQSVGRNFASEICFSGLSSKDDGNKKLSYQEIIRVAESIASICNHDKSDIELLARRIKLHLPEFEGMTINISASKADSKNNQSLATLRKLRDEDAVYTDGMKLASTYPYYAALIGIGYAVVGCEYDQRSNLGSNPNPKVMLIGSNQQETRMVVFGEGTQNSPRCDRRIEASRGLELVENGLKFMKRLR